MDIPNVLVLVRMQLLQLGIIHMLEMARVNTIISSSNNVEKLIEEADRSQPCIIVSDFDIENKRERSILSILLQRHHQLCVILVSNMDNKIQVYTKRENPIVEFQDFLSYFHKMKHIVLNKELFRKKYMMEI